jgi:exosome complex protein LRP1
MSDQAVDAFGSVEQTLAAVEEHLAVFKQTSMEEFMAPLSALERAKVQVSLGTCSKHFTSVANHRLTWSLAVTITIAYTINALLFVFLKTQGVSPKDIRQTHVKQELVSRSSLVFTKSAQDGKSNC